MSSAPDLRARLVALESERVALERQLDDECLRVYATAVRGRSFSAQELWNHQVASCELRAVFAAAGIRSPRQLGKQLQRLARGTHAGWGLERLGADSEGAIWAVRVLEHSHPGACLVAPARV